MLQISVRYLHNDIILPVSQRSIYGARNEYFREYIGDTSLKMYMQKHINPIRKRNKM